MKRTNLFDCGFVVSGFELFPDTHIVLVSAHGAVQDKGVDVGDDEVAEGLCNRLLHLLLQRLLRVIGNSSRVLSIYGCELCLDEQILPLQFTCNNIGVAET